MSDLTPEEREARYAAAAALQAKAQPLLPGPCDLLDIERRRVEVGDHVLLAIDLWFSPVMADEPVFYLGLLCDPEAANIVHLLSPEQYAHFINQAPEATTNQADEANDKEAHRG